MAEVVFGVMYDYVDKQIPQATLRFSSSPFAENLPINEVDATIDNNDRLYNMVNPEGLFAYLQDGQYMDCYMAVGGEELKMGRFYFTSAKSEDGGLTAQITFNDRLYLLDNGKYNLGSDGTWTLAQAVTSILTATGVELETVYGTGLASTTIQRCIPQDTTPREALRLACQAARCTCYIDRENRLAFVRPALGNSSQDIDRNCLRSDAQIVVEPSYNVVELTVRNEYVEGAEEVVYTAKNVAENDYERVYTLDNPLVNDGNAVASWVLSWLQRRVTYDFNYRGNPALDVFDTIQIFDVYGVNGNALLTEHNLSFGGGLEADGKAIR